MLLVDDILFFPIHSIMWVFKEVGEIAQKELAGEATSITEQLRILYMQLETGRITEAEFEAGEKVLLDRLDLLESRQGDHNNPGESPRPSPSPEKKSCWPGSTSSRAAWTTKATRKNRTTTKPKNPTARADPWRDARKRRNEPADAIVLLEARPPTPAVRGQGRSGQNHLRYGCRAAPLGAGARPFYPAGLHRPRPFCARLARRIRASRQAARSRTGCAAMSGRFPREERRHVARNCCRRHLPGR